MKYLISLLYLISTMGFSQIPENKLDNTTEYIIELINEIRIDNGLDALTIDTSLVKASKHHTEYMMVYYPQNKKAYSHSETLRDSSHLIKTIPSFRDRALEYGENLVNKGISENVLARKISYNTFENVKDSKTNSSSKCVVVDSSDIKNTYDGRISLYNSLKSDSIDYKAAAKYIVYEWMLSSHHRSALLKENGINIGAYQSVHVKDGKSYAIGTFMITFKQ